MQQLQLPFKELDEPMQELDDLIIELDRIIYNKNTSDEDRLFFANQKAELLFGLGQYIGLEKLRTN